MADKASDLAHRIHYGSMGPRIGAQAIRDEFDRLRSQRDGLLAAAKRMVGADTCDCYLNDPLDPECAWCQLSKAIARVEADNE